MHVQGFNYKFEINGDVLDQRIIDFINEEAPDGLLRFELVFNQLMNQLIR